MGIILWGIVFFAQVLDCDFGVWDFDFCVGVGGLWGWWVYFLVNNLLFMKKYVSLHIVY